METKKTLPTFMSDEDAEKFVASADLSDYDLSGFTPVTFEFVRRKGNGSDEPPSALPASPPHGGRTDRSTASAVVRGNAGEGEAALSPLWGDVTQ